ncbi:MAG: hypothetical protein LAO20_18305 [Acidobacteriia bacterium]|nr:hypothetical protein [Terriglobia bacterium]
MQLEYIAVDWSGAAVGAHKTIWLARCVGNTLVELENGLSRERVADRLVEHARRNPNIVLGLDFAFSMPIWFIREHNISCCDELWDFVASNGENWLRSCQPPFWGRPGRHRPELPEHYRWTEKEVGSVKGINAKSVFQIFGAGAVGTGSLRGMPFLSKLRREGFSIWPFDSSCLPCAIEIYPRLLTGPVKKNDQGEREKYLRESLPDLNLAFREKASRSDDAFDAAVSALVMSKHLVNPLLQLRHSTDERILLEGRIWQPASV